MALYQPELKLEIIKASVSKLIAHISIEVNKGEDLQLDFNNTSAASRITNFRYSVIKNRNQDYPIEYFHVNIPWDEKTHTVEVTVVDSTGIPLGHTSGTSDDADTDL